MKHGVKEVCLQVSVHANNDVVYYRHIRKQIDDLVCSGHAQIMNLIRLLAFDVRTIEDDAAFVCVIYAADTVEAGRLAGTVWANQCHDLVVRHFQRNVVIRDQLAETERHMFNFQHRFEPPFLPSALS